MTMSESKCRHKDIVVDYDHPHGLIQNVSLAELQGSPKEVTQSSMTLINPRCKNCGKALAEAELTIRIQQGGDLYDERFIFIISS
jgi:hypothetical protein